MGLGHQDRVIKMKNNRKEHGLSDRVQVSKESSFNLAEVTVINPILTTPLF